METQPMDIALKGHNPFKQGKGERKRLEIIQAAIECLATIGFEKTTYEAIAKKIGSNRAHVAYYFGGKDEIFKSCILFIITNYQGMLNQELGKARTKEEEFEFYLRTVFKWAEEYPNQLSVMLLLYYLATVHEEYQKLHLEIRNSGQVRIATIITDLTGLPYKDGMALSKCVQNLVSGAIMDATTTGRCINEACDQVIESSITIIGYKA